MPRTASPPRRKAPKGTGRAASGVEGGTVRTFPPGASPIVIRATPGCIHCCGRCETHPCRLKGQL